MNYLHNKQHHLNLRKQGISTLVATLAMTISSSAFATSYTVNSLDDTSSGTCATSCTLRDAITTANDNGGSDNINFSVNGVITLTSPLPTITGELTIDGTRKKYRNKW